MSSSTSSLQLLERDEECKVDYCVLTTEHERDAFELLLSAFEKEPSGASLGLVREDWRVFVEYHLRVCVSNGYSVIALDSETRETIGVCINLDFAELPEEDLESLISPKFAPLLEILVQSEKPYKELLHKESQSELPLPKGKVFHILMLGSKPGQGKRGLGQKLSSLSVSRAKHFGFERCVVETSGAFSFKCFQRLGFQSVVDIPYKDFEFNSSKPFLNVEAPHTSFCLQELKL